MADATNKLANGIKKTGNQAVINRFNQSNNSFDDVQQIIEDSGIDRSQKNKLKKQARSAYSWYMKKRQERIISMILFYLT